MQFLPHRVLLQLSMVVLGASGATWAQQSVGELYATDASVKGSVQLAGSGTNVLSGSAIQAGSQSATLKLERGGNLLVCSGTTLSVSASQSGRELLYSVNTGNVELDYPLGASQDTLLTPDFRIVMPGPGRLHAAVRVTASGDTCVQTLPSNSTAIVVYETIDDAAYQVKDNEAVLFRGGHIKDVMPEHQSCGCPAPQKGQVAKTAPPPPPPEPVPDAKPAPMLAEEAPDQHVTATAPFVFHGDDPQADLGESVVSLKLEKNQFIALDPVLLPPAQTKESQPTTQAAQPASESAKRHGFLARVGAFFAGIFK